MKLELTARPTTVTSLESSLLLSPRRLLVSNLPPLLLMLSPLKLEPSEERLTPSSPTKLLSPTSLNSQRTSSVKITPRRSKRTPRTSSPSKTSPSERSRFSRDPNWMPLKSLNYTPTKREVKRLLAEMVPPKKVLLRTWLLSEIKNEYIIFNNNKYFNL